MAKKLISIPDNAYFTAFFDACVNEEAQYSNSSASGVILSAVIDKLASPNDDAQLIIRDLYLGKSNVRDSFVALFSLISGNRRRQTEANIAIIEAIKREITEQPLSYDYLYGDKYDPRYLQNKLDSVVDIAQREVARYAARLKCGIMITNYVPDNIDERAILRDVYCNMVYVDTPDAVEQRAAAFARIADDFGKDGYKSLNMREIIDLLLNSWPHMYAYNVIYSFLIELLRGCTFRENIDRRALRHDIVTAVQSWAPIS